MANPQLQQIPVGDLQLYDNYVPQLDAGNWTIKVSQTLTQGNTTINQEPITSSQEFVVSAPQFSMDLTQVINQYPPAGSTGLYGNALPHIVLNDAMLPWERVMAGGSDAAVRTPWMALMVFEDGELTGGTNSTTYTIPSTVGDFLNIQPPTLAPKPVKEDDIDPDSPCGYIQMPVSVFSACAPLLAELRFLTHCRQVNTDDKAMMGLNEDGLFSVIVSNRFPAAPATGSKQPVKNIAHLVSLEGMESYLAEGASFGNYQQVALLSLASWVFYTLPDLSEDFRALALNIVSSETNNTDPKNPVLVPGNLWLRLPDAVSGSDSYAVEVNKRLSEGYLPMSYHARTGEDGFAWYRGPFTPVLPAAIQKPSPFFTSDAAMIYDKLFGLFDCSLAAAWQAGREAALSDRMFGQRLLSFRQKAHRFTDALYNRLVSDNFSATQIDELDNDTSVQDEFLAILDTQLIKDIGATPDTNIVGSPQNNAAPTDPVADAKAFMAEPQVLAMITEMVTDELAYVTEWLGKLLLFYPLPFNKLVADERMLPLESLRFFYWDGNWADALLDGAMSIGIDSSRQSFFMEVTKGLIQRGAMDALTVYRNKLRGIDTAPPPPVPSVICGFLLRSALVSGWPNLAVRGYDAADGQGKLLNLLRMDHLSPNILLCLFDGIPASVELSEPQEGFGFGLDDDGNAVLRNLVAPGGGKTTPIGAQIGSPFSVRDMTGQKAVYMRAAGSRTLNVAGNNGLTGGLATALGNAGSPPPGGSVGPADWALQMIKSPEAIVFNSQTK